MKTPFIPKKMKVFGVNDLDPNLSQSYLNQIRLFINLDSRIDWKIDKKKSKTFLPKVLLNNSKGNIYT